MKPVRNLVETLGSKLTQFVESNCKSPIRNRHANNISNGLNKKLILIITIIFIAVNIATYLFATGKVRTIEKFITVYKDKDVSESSSASLKEDVKSLKNEKTVSSLSVGNSVKDLSNFNDANHIIQGNNSNNKLTAINATSNDTNTKAVPKNTEASAPKSEQAITGHSNTTNTNIINSNTSNFNGPENYPAEAKITADENIPLPQLPLFDTDFEDNKETGNNNENIALPSLPEIDS